MALAAETERVVSPCCGKTRIIELEDEPPAKEAARKRKSVARSRVTESGCKLWSVSIIEFANFYLCVAMSR